MKEIYYVREYIQVRTLMHRVKKRYPDAIKELAKRMHSYFPRNAVLIPIPSSDGTTDLNMEILRAVKLLRKDIVILDILVGEARYSWYKLKKNNVQVDIDFFGFKNIWGNYSSYSLENAFLFDPVVDTGSTHKAACEALGVFTPLWAYANNSKTKKIVYSSRQKKSF